MPTKKPARIVAADFFMDTIHLDGEHKGFLLCAIVFASMHEGQIPGGAEALARVIGSTIEDVEELMKETGDWFWIDTRGKLWVSADSQKARKLDLEANMQVREEPDA